MELRALTGLGDVRQLGQILSVDGDEKLSFWRGDACNEIRGTDGSVFHPGITQNETLYIFNKDLCRSLPLVYQRPVAATAEKLPALRFSPPEDVFDNESPASCFCAEGEDKSVCSKLPSGLFNLSVCQFGSPVLLSWPHFFQVCTLLGVNNIRKVRRNENKRTFLQRNYTIVVCSFLPWFLFPRRINDCWTPSKDYLLTLKSIASSSTFSRSVTWSVIMCRTLCFTR